MGIWALLISGLVVVLLLAGIGYAVKYRKAYWLINGYRYLSDEQKKDVDIEGLGRFLGNSLFVSAVLAAASFALLAFNQVGYGLGALGVLLAFVIYMAVAAQRFMHKGTERKHMSKQMIVTLVLLAIVLGGSAVGVYALINASIQPVQYNISADTLEIKCMFGEKVKLADIQGLEVMQAMPEIKERTNGAAMNGVLRGSFMLASGTAARIFTENENPPFIHFKSGQKEYLINLATAEETNKLFADLGKALK